MAGNRWHDGAADMDMSNRAWQRTPRAGAGEQPWAAIGEIPGFFAPAGREADLASRTGTGQRWS
jgi:hypothetical protein